MPYKETRVTNTLGRESEAIKKRKQVAFSEAEERIRKARVDSLAMTPGTNNRVLLHLEKVNQIAQGADKRDVQGLRERFYKYAELCANMDMKMGNQTAYRAMGLDGYTIMAWRNGEGDTTAEQKAFANEVLQICSAYREQLLLDSHSGLNPVVGIFWQKNYDRLKDNPENIIPKDNGMEIKRSASQIKEELEGMGEVKK